MADSKLSKKTFLYSYRNKTYTVSSDSSSKVLSALLTDSDFQKAYATKAGMDLIIERKKPNTPAISETFPCFLLESDEVLELRFIKRNPNSAHRAENHEQNLHQRRPEDLLTFLVNTTGGKGIQNIIMRNKNLKREVKCVCVVAVKGDTVKKALRKDGRFAKDLFKKDFALEDDERSVTKMKNSVDELKDKKQYSIVLNSAEPMPDSLDMLDDQDGTDDQIPSTSKADSCPQSANPKGHSSEHSSQSSDKKMPTTTKIKHGFKERTVEFIPSTGEILNLLRSQFDSLIKQLKVREQVKSSGQVQQVLREEFSKETQCFSHIKTVKKLMDQSASVCHIRVNHQARGTGFLLFDKFILTNAHVITNAGKLLDNLSVTFDFEDLRTANKEEFALKRKPLAYKRSSTQQHNMDFALMELKKSPKELPSPLLKYYSAPPARGGVCIIGHPDSGVKKMDSCLIVGRAQQEQAVQKHISDHPEHLQIIAEAYFETKQRLDDTQIEYHSCFFYGSSGSPVFDEHCYLVGMHTGGYVHEKVKLPFISIIEYALPLLPILVSILRQTKEKRKEVWHSFSNEKNTKLVMKLAEDKTYRPDLTDENIWDAESSEDEEEESWESKEEDEDEEEDSGESEEEDGEEDEEDKSEEEESGESEEEDEDEEGGVMDWEDSSP